jgi:uncharacterized membrane protein
MTTPSSSASAKVWQAIESERRRDRVLRRVSLTAWAATIFFALVLAIIVCVHVAQLARSARVGVVTWTTVVGATVPLVIAFGLLSVLIATLSTIGIFLRLRTASLAEIQLRLAALEDLIASPDDRSNVTAR